LPKQLQHRERPSETAMNRVFRKKNIARKGTIASSTCINTHCLFHSDCIVVFTGDSLPERQEARSMFQESRKFSFTFCWALGKNEAVRRMSREVHA
ncbi:hypothetical protein KBA41_15265, partial [Candidatus Ozemobacteraceae bacterium]|nr:hypothetical protein [Candidatus Ozemobacteraceae bacterium]